MLTMRVLKLSGMRLRKDETPGPVIELTAEEKAANGSNAGDQPSLSVDASAAQTQNNQGERPPEEGRKDSAEDKKDDSAVASSSQAANSASAGSSSSTDKQEKQFCREPARGGEEGRSRRSW